MSNYEVEDRGLQNTTMMAQVEQARALQEVQAPFVIAKKFQRNEEKAFKNILNACDRYFLADQALYAYPRGGSIVTGPSIRLAEMLLQKWGNCESGIKELSQSNGVSICEAFAIDLETNVKVSKIFHVKHERVTRDSRKNLTDPRDIYEIAANNGARRMRACILAIIPGDVTEEAVNRCKKTMASNKKPMKERIPVMISKFEEVGVTQSMIEKKLGHKIESILEKEFFDLMMIFRSINDNVAKKEDFFKLDDSEKPVEKKVAALQEKIEQQEKKETSYQVQNPESKKEKYFKYFESKGISEKQILSYFQLEEKNSITDDQISILENIRQENISNGLSLIDEFSKTVAKETGESNEQN